LVAHRRRSSPIRWRDPVKIIAALLFALLLTGWLVAQSGKTVSQAAQGSEPVAWRRTEKGWENAANWWNEEIGTAKPLHPSVLASFCLLASLLALAAFSERQTAKEPEAAQSSEPFSGARLDSAENLKKSCTKIAAARH
jgi:hypothetical protein